jgi:hypothetical protein
MLGSKVSGGSSGGTAITRTFMGGSNQSVVADASYVGTPLAATIPANSKGRITWSLGNLGTVWWVYLSYTGDVVSAIIRPERLPLTGSTTLIPTSGGFLTQLDHAMATNVYSTYEVAIDVETGDAGAVFTPTFTKKGADGTVLAANTYVTVEIF